jgi:hypothetical protein
MILRDRRPVTVNDGLAWSAGSRRKAQSGVGARDAFYTKLSSSNRNEEKIRLESGSWGKTRVLSEGEREKRRALPTRRGEEEHFHAFSSVRILA